MPLYMRHIEPWYRFKLDHGVIELLIANPTAGRWQYRTPHKHHAWKNGYAYIDDQVREMIVYTNGKKADKILIAVDHLIVAAIRACPIQGIHITSLAARNWSSTQIPSERTWIENTVAIIRVPNNGRGTIGTMSEANTQNPGIQTGRWFIEVVANQYQLNAPEIFRTGGARIQELARQTEQQREDERLENERREQIRHEAERRRALERESQPTSNDDWDMAESTPAVATRPRVVRPSPVVPMTGILAVDDELQRMSRQTQRTQRSLGLIEMLDSAEGGLPADLQRERDRINRTAHRYATVTAEQLQAAIPQGTRRHSRLERMADSDEFLEQTAYVTGVTPEELMQSPESVRAQRPKERKPNRQQSQDQTVVARRNTAITRLKQTLERDSTIVRYLQAHQKDLASQGIFIPAKELRAMANEIREYLDGIVQESATGRLYRPIFKDLSLAPEAIWRAVRQRATLSRWYELQRQLEEAVLLVEARDPEANAVIDLLRQLIQDEQEDQGLQGADRLDIDQYIGNQRRQPAEQIDIDRRQEFYENWLKRQETTLKKAKATTTASNAGKQTVPNK